MIVKYINFLLVCLVTLFSINVHSLQLGKIIFKSNQNAPLDVAIQVNLTSEDKIDLLKPSIAPKENYDSQGIERTKIHNDITLSLISKKPNQASLRLTSKIPVTEPFLDLLIQIESPNGKILKEYTVLLDPPVSIVPRKKAEEKKVILKNKPEKIKKVEEKKVIQKKVKNKASKKRKVVTAIPGKTLFQIARENSIAGITTEQIVIAIYQLNPNSFDGNLNGLIKGKELKLPFSNYYKKLSHLDARKILKKENFEWKKNSKLTKPKPKTNKKNKNKVNKIQKNSDELSRLKKELEITNKKLQEKEQALEVIRMTKKSIIPTKEVEKQSLVIASDSIEEIKEEQMEPLIEDSTNSFISSVTDQNQNIIKEVILDDENNNNSIKPIFVLLLLFLLTLLLGLLFIVRKKKKEINSDHFSGLSDTFENIQPETKEDMSEINSSYDDFSQKNSVTQSSDDVSLSNDNNFNSINSKDDDSR